MSKNKTTLCHHITISLIPPTIKEESPSSIQSVTSTPNNKSAISEDLQSDVFNESDRSERSSDRGKRRSDLCKFSLNFFKYLIFFSIWIVCCYLLISSRENIHQLHQLSIQKEFTTEYMIDEAPQDGRIRIYIGGALLPKYYANLSTRWVYVYIQMIETENCLRKVLKPSNVKNVENITEVWEIATVTEDLIGIVPEVSQTKVFNLNKTVLNTSSNYFLQVCLSTNLKENFPISLGYNTEPINIKTGVIIAGLILIGLYIIIIFELLHRTVAAIFTCVLSVAVLAAFNAKPAFDEIVIWANVDTLMLLFSMMILVTVISETGIFDFMAVQTYKITGGKIWPLVNTLCVITVFLACFLDNVTTALLITPVTIRLSEVMKLNPVPVLTCMMMFSNIGGAITPIGDPPNVIIATNSDVVKSGVTFLSFIFHMALGSISCFIVTYIFIKFYYKDDRSFRHVEPPEVYELKSKIATLRRTVASVSSYSRDENLLKEDMKKETAKLVGRLEYTVHNVTTTEEKFCMNLYDLQKKYPIKDKKLLYKSGGVLVLVIIVLCLQSIPSFSSLGMSWTALLGAVLVMLLYDKDDVVGIFTRIEWSTLIYFAALFILMEALSRLGLIDSIGTQTEMMISSIVPEYRLTVAIILILWVSGIASAFVDNLPLTTMMIKIVTNLAKDSELDLPLQPMIWALSFGSCLGGNGSLFGSSSNIICASVAEQHGYKFSFIEFFKVGVPILILTLIVTSIYLIICHVVFQWNF